ncbi:MAG: tyrosine--tRNA ligase [Gemmatimonadetes bacterium 13_1_40CM_4_69_8]|nr:MAG: tyrosine--tRNA ligase [Gemmatimonadetes bacterium 13_1_40CM_69_22]OLC69018.1 MAG: tyrosine--tRNA ligase [Gemmatimonadetes bacterium 13_1_40CM_4_69_8]
MSDLFAELEWRGFLHHATQQIQRHLAERPRTVYCGFDPTAPSFQLGNLMPVMLLRHFQLHGHKPIVLMGGGTGLIGDPSGKPSERPLLSNEQIRDNVHRYRDQVARLLDFDSKDRRALVLNNADWLVEQRLVDFLRDVGKHFTVNVMLQKESVQARLDAGISYTEFSYMLLQAYDFLHLFRKEQCTIQVGGSDQWGNITAGIDLIRRVEGSEAHGLVAPLFTTATGAKFGKTESGAIWLDPARTSVYKFFQFWLNTDDRDAERYLKLFTFLPRAEIDALVAKLKANPAAREAQRALARDVTERVHGPDATAKVIRASEVLFGGFDPHAADDAVFEVLALELPTATAPARDGLTLVDAVIQAGLAKSKSEARRAIEQGGIYVNQQRVKDPARSIASADWLAGRNLLLRKGKKEYGLLRLSQ